MVVWTREKTWTRVSQHRGRPAASLSQSGPIISWISDAVPRSPPSTEPAPKRGRPAHHQPPRYLPVWCSVVCRPPTLVFPPALGRMPRMQSPGGLLVVWRGSWFPQWLGVAAHVPMVPRCDEVRRDGRRIPGWLGWVCGRRPWRNRRAGMDKAVWPGGTRMSRYGNWQTGDDVVESQRRRIVPVPTPVAARADWAAVALQARP